ncbi:hypothetical protein J3R82DRAFT_1533 [Butyriboletus roseoflavus]|nr:hypothetical protein J3R82DRAFT_1533 [Butyriboletus roseoflavus]
MLSRIWRIGGRQTHASIANTASPNLPPRSGTITERDCQIPEAVAVALLQLSEYVLDAPISVQGPDFDKSLSLQDLLHSYERIGFQAPSFVRAVDIVNCMASNFMGEIQIWLKPA